MQFNHIQRLYEEIRLIPQTPDEILDGILDEEDEILDEDYELDYYPEEDEVFYEDYELDYYPEEVDTIKFDSYLKPHKITQIEIDGFIYINHSDHTYSNCVRTFGGVDSFFGITFGDTGTFLGIGIRNPIARELII